MGRRIINSDDFFELNTIMKILKPRGREEAEQRRHSIILFVIGRVDFWPNAVIMSFHRTHGLKIPYYFHF